MGAAPENFDTARFRRALDRLADHCEISAQRAAAIEKRRVAVREQLERELGPELTRTLLAGLAHAG